MENGAIILAFLFFKLLNSIKILDGLHMVIKSILFILLFFNSFKERMIGFSFLINMLIFFVFLYNSSPFAKIKILRFLKLPGNHLPFGFPT